MSVIRRTDRVSVVQIQLTDASAARATLRRENNGQGDAGQASINAESGHDDDTYFVSVITSLIIVLLALFAAIYINGLRDKDSIDVFMPNQHVGIFALLYIVAQAVERLLEPLSLFLLPTKKAKDERDQNVASFLNDPSNDGKIAAAKQAELDSKRIHRAFLFWGIATAVAMLACAYLKIYLLQLTGIIDIPRWVEILVTGIIVGSGTKPLHDLISRIEKAKNNAEDPPEVTGTT